MSHTHSHHSDNPFFNRQRITDTAYFFGREREIEALYSAIATRQCRSIVGERKMGKSSLLSHLANPATLQAHNFDPSRYVFVYVDLEGMANITYDEFWIELMDRLETALPATHTDLQAKARELADQAEIRFMQVRRFLRQVDRAGLVMVWMLDEFESLATNVEFNSSFYGELRSLAGELGVVYITASKRSLYDLTYQHADTLSSPFFNIFSEESLGLLPENEAHALLDGLSRMGNGRPFTPDERQFLLQLAGSHPFFLQLAAFYWHQAAQSGLEASVLPEKVAYRFRTEAEDHFRYVWNQLKQEEQMGLLRLETAVPDMVKHLWQKALVRKKDNKPELFSQAFAEFVSRMDSPTNAPGTTAVSSRTGTTDLTGATLGNYRVLSMLGRGGMAVVYKGYQSSLDRYVAIKVMSRLLADDLRFIERFQREAAGVAQLRHQNIVQMYDFAIQDDISYMVMEYIEGETLKQRLAYYRSVGTRIPLREVARVLRDIAAALDYAHAHGIIHRDVKPANIMLRQEERLAKLTGDVPFAGVLTDFGVARMLEGMQLTGTGATIGTPDYMSPEQARGEPAESSSDIYALGIILYEMLTSELPFTADTPVAVLLKHMQSDPPSVIMKVPELPVALENVLLKALAKDPQDRFPTSSKLAEAVSLAVEGRT